MSQITGGGGIDSQQNEIQYMRVSTIPMNKKGFVWNINRSEDYFRLNMM